MAIEQSQTLVRVNHFYVRSGAVHSFVAIPMRCVTCFTHFDDCCTRLWAF
jgi:hypothetical protein